MSTSRSKISKLKKGNIDLSLLNFWPEPNSDEFIELDGPGSVLDEIFQEGARLVYHETSESITQNFIRGVAHSQDILGRLDNEDESVGAIFAWWADGYDYDYDKRRQEKSVGLPEPSRAISGVKYCYPWSLGTQVLLRL